MVLTANSLGVIEGKFTIPANVPTGNKNVVAIGQGGSRGSAVFSGIGTEEIQTWQQQTTIITRVAPQRVDPLAQTFTTDRNAQVTGVDLWFAVKPTTTGRVQIRTTTAGFPDQTILADVAFAPASVTLSGPTQFLFEAPVRLTGGVEYALVVMCDDANGALSIAELGKFDPTAQRWITAQPYTVGVLLSSSNASTWTAHQDRDLAFRLLGAAFTETTKLLDLGTVAVTGATDLLVLGYAELPASLTTVEYQLGLPDGTEIVVTDGQVAKLAEAITGTVSMKARLTGTADFAPVLFPGAQLIAGAQATQADYVARAVPGGVGVTVKVIYEANLPSGSAVDVFYKGADLADVWDDVPVDSVTAMDDGFFEFEHIVSGVTETQVQTKLRLYGSPAARPRVRDLRVIVM